MKYDEVYDSLIKAAADRNEFVSDDWLRFKAQIKAESNFDPNARSHVGAMGLAQFMPATWNEWGKKKDPFNPEANIDAQVRYMKWLLARVTQWDCAYAAYNWGIGNVLKVWQNPLWKLQAPLETREYLVRIDKYFSEYKKHG